MAGERYAEYVNKTLYDFLHPDGTDELATQLAAVRTEQGGLTQTQLPDPEDIIDGEQLNRHESPLVMVYTDAGGPDRDQDAGVGQRNNMYDYDSHIVVQYMSGVDLAVGRNVLNKYLTAITTLVRTYPTLSDATNQINGVQLTDWRVVPSIDERQAVWLSLIVDLEIRARTP